MKIIEFYFDFVSPYSYLSWVQLFHYFSPNNDGLSSLDRKKFILKPIFLSQIFSSYDQVPPAQITSKRDYLFKRCLKVAEKKSIRLNIPAVLPFNPLFALRLATRECSGENQIKVIDLLFKLIWEKSIDPSDPQAIIREMNEYGLPGEELIDASMKRDIKLALRKNNQEALERGVFGAPSFYVARKESSGNLEDESEIFWGEDSLEDLQLYLKGKNYYNKDKFLNFLEKVL